MLDALVEVSREKSVVASNRIEGVSTPDGSLRNLFDEGAEPSDQDGKAICACADYYNALRPGQTERQRILPEAVSSRPFTPERVIIATRNGGFLV